MLLFFIVLYLLSNVAIGAWAARRVTNSQDFILAGRRLPLALATSVTFATWFGSETIMGAPAMFVEGGFLAVIEEPFGSALCLFLVGALFARPLYRLNITTFSDYFRIRFGRAAELLSAIMVIPSYFSWISAQLVAIGIVLNVVTDVPREYCIIASAIVVMIYTLLGGMWSISITDFFHNLIIILALAALGFILWDQIKGWDQIRKSTPSGFFRFLPASTTKDWLAYIAAWITVGLGSIPQQDVFQRVMAAKNEKVAVRASLLASSMYVTIAMLPLFIALSAKLVHLDLPKDNQLIIPNMVIQHGSLPLQVLFFGAIISAILSVSSGAILAPATVFGENIIKFFYPTISDKALLKTIRWAIVVITCICVLMSTIRDTNIFDLVGESSAFSLVSLFVPLAAGIYWKRANLVGCISSMTVGLLVWLTNVWQGSDYPPILWGLLASTLGMIAGSLLSTPSAVTHQATADGN
ncbi:MULTISPECIES: sodium:solute symporter family protein [unclassified Spirosoma]|uniref:sodium:solute symporter family protein n=1 Tax=unclassified Spirosoma TaxID=2621999 RepID=UPI000961260E|nr:MULTISPECIES: sodium:solute symporter family protein [unclassified Spirosoma]MBN8824972.1 sodium:solute symporter family protein [Spirosoma sp.]OJW73396.1 MAG: sodium:solute symporter [Spirosoma sp. 48-14]